MLRVLLVLVYLLFPHAGRAQDYFIACQRATDTFVLAHTWEYYGYDVFTEALEYYGLRKRYDGIPACETFSAYLREGVEQSPVLMEYDFMVPGEYSVYMHFYAWQGATEDGTFTVLSTIAPE